MRLADVAHGLEARIWLTPPRSMPKPEAKRKHSGSASEARNGLCLEENQKFSFRSEKKIPQRPEAKACFRREPIQQREKVGGQLSLRRAAPKKAFPREIPTKTTNRKWRYES
jgi:hypothetical protein